MKTIFYFVLFSLCLLLIGCSGSEEPEKTEEEVTAAPVNNKDGDDSGDNGSLKIFFFDIGKADAFLLYNNKTTILIDTGEKGNGKDILQYMENNNIESIDYLFITHFDKDHVGGANKILGNVPVRQIYTNNCIKESDEYNSYTSRVKEKAIPAIALTEPLSFEENGIKVEVNVPAREMYEEDLSNNSSLIIKITYGENTFLFMGDALGERTREYLSSEPGQCDVLKMPHHGSYMGCLTDLLQKTRPKYAVITSSKEEKEADATKELLEKYKVKLYRTRKGGILMKSDGKEIEVLQVS